jgi:hypothetical protein
MKSRRDYWQKATATTTLAINQQVRRFYDIQAMI